MSIARSAGEVLREHVACELEGIDRMYLNLYVPKIQHERGVVGFFSKHRGFSYVTSALMTSMTDAFVSEIQKYAKDNGIEIVAFERRQRKDDVMQERLRTYQAAQGVVFIGKAQEKAAVFSSTKRRNPETGKEYAWIIRHEVFVNYYYFYCVDEDFGPFFIKFCSYFPYNAKVCINGHEYLKRQLSKEGIAFEALDNGIRSCGDLERAQEICDRLDAGKIDALARKWLAIVPNPFTQQDRYAGFCYQLSILQAEFSLTQVFDRPLHGRIFFEEIIRENIDLGRPDQMQLIFERRVRKDTPGKFRTRIVTEGVQPSLHAHYKSAHIKQYFKEGRGLRTETTINDTRDFKIPRGLTNLDRLRQVGFRANRRLLEVERISQDSGLGEGVFETLQRPVAQGTQRTSAMTFGDPMVLALLSVLVLFPLQVEGVSNRTFREYLAPLLGLEPSQLTPGRMTYQLRRLRMHGLIARIDGTHRYQATADGLRIALFYTRLHARLIRNGLAQVIPEVEPPRPSELRAAFRNLEKAIDHYCQEKRAA